MHLSTIKEDTEVFLQEPVTSAVISAPSFYSLRQIERIRAAEQLQDSMY